MRKGILLSMLFISLIGCKSLPPEITNGEYDIYPNKYDYLATAVMFALEDQKSQTKNEKIIIEKMINVWRSPHKYKLFNYNQSSCKNGRHLSCIYIRLMGNERCKLNQFRLMQFDYWLNDKDELPFKEEIKEAIRELSCSGQRGQR